MKISKKSPKRNNELKRVDHVALCVHKILSDFVHDSLVVILTFTDSAGHSVSLLISINIHQSN